MNLPAHSPLGASGASRWMKCPASVSLSFGIEDSESDHASLGTNAHKLAETCLRMNQDAWTLIGEETGWGFLVDKPMADAVQVYLDAVRKTHPNRTQRNSWIERSFSCPMIHQFFYGTADFIYLDDEGEEWVLHTWDYKHGAGIIIEVQDNSQLKYYALGALMDLGLFGKVKTVTLHVAQPRGFHSSGPIREWSISTDDLLAWGTEELVPAMNRATGSRDTESGEHCRFCPARAMACPQILKDVQEFETMAKPIMEDKGAAAKLTNEEVARFLNLKDVVKIAVKAAEATAFSRLSAGAPIPGYQLVAKRANREWRPEAVDQLKAKFGDDAYTAPELKSPAQIEELPEGEAFVSKYAFKPDTGLTIDKAGKGRAAVNRDTKSLFQDQTKKKGKAA